MSDTSHNFPFSVDTCHYLPDVTNEIKNLCALVGTNEGLDIIKALNIREDGK